MAHSMNQLNSLILQKNGVSSIQQVAPPSQSNGEAERAVETTKSLLKRENDPSKGRWCTGLPLLLVDVHHLNYSWEKN